MTWIIMTEVSITHFITQYVTHFINQFTTQLLLSLLILISILISFNEKLSFYCSEHLSLKRANMYLAR